MSENIISFDLSEEQVMMKETISQLVKNNILDNAHNMDENKDLPLEFLQKFWGLGIPASNIPEAYGGFGMDSSPSMNAIVLEELACGDMSFAIAATLPLLFALTVSEMGTEDQKSKYLPSFCSEKFFPATAAVNEMRFGFDASQPATTAVKKNGSYIINGGKCFVPLADSAELMLVAAFCDNKADLFIVEKGTPGVTVQEREKNLGLYALATNEVTFKDCEIPAENRLGGDQGCNFDLFLQKSRIALSAIGTGISRASYEYAKSYARERKQFGEPIASRQSIAFMIAEMAYEVDAMRLLTWKAASALENGKDARRESYLAKLYAGDMTMKITDYGVQILGGHGYVRDHPVERYYRNGRGIAILEGMALV